MSAERTGEQGWHGFAIEGDLHSCWLCQRPVAAQGLRCENCGALQPVRDLNNFAILGLNERFDLDQDDLDRHFALARRNLDPERLGIKNPRVGALAQRYSVLMATAYEVLRDPVSRARYLLELLDAKALARGDEPVGLPVDATNNLDRENLAVALAEATDCQTVDRIGARAMREIEPCIHSLSTAFRAGRIGEARLALAHIARLEQLTATARRRRLELCPPPAQ